MKRSYRVDVCEQGGEWVEVCRYCGGESPELVVLFRVRERDDLEYAHGRCHSEAEVVRSALRSSRAVIDGVGVVVRRLANATGN